MTTRIRPAPLSRKQHELMLKLEEALASSTYRPSIRELSETVGRAHSSLIEMLGRLEEKGWIRYADAEITLLHRVPRQGEQPVALHGAIAGGQPILVVEEPARLVSLPGLAPPSPGHAYLRVVGSSMVNDHILDGDIVLVRTQTTVDQGAIAAVLVDEELLTLKRVYRERGNKVRLQPASDRHEPMIFGAARVQIRGKVVGMYRPVG